jgi:hypothetical protein
MMKGYIKTVYIRVGLAGWVLCFAAANTFSQSYTITRTAIGSGGQSANGTLTMGSTIGQPVSGSASTGGSITLSPGFWYYDSAFVTVSGRVTALQGRGVTNATVRITGPGTDTFVRTGRLGTFTILSVRSGFSYTITVISRRFIFPNSPRTLFVGDNLAGIDFVGGLRDSLDVYSTSR